MKDEDKVIIATIILTFLAITASVVVAYWLGNLVRG